MAPPGIPDFFTRNRIVDAGRVLLLGRAWSGSGKIESVEVGIDGTWSEAVLDQPIGEWAWRGWTFEWVATPGEHLLSCRATDSANNRQPDEQPWNYQGMGNNSAQTVRIAVR